MPARSCSEAEGGGPGNNHRHAARRRHAGAASAHRAACVALELAFSSTVAVHKSFIDGAIGGVAGLVWKRSRNSPFAGPQADAHLTGEQRQAGGSRRRRPALFVKPPVFERRHAATARMEPGFARVILHIDFDAYYTQVPSKGCSVPDRLARSR